MTRIYFGTNRNLIASKNSEQGFDFGSNFSDDGLANLRFGKAEVTGDDFSNYEIQLAPENLLSEPPVLGSQTILRELSKQMRDNAEEKLLKKSGGTRRKLGDKDENKVSSSPRLSLA